MILASSWSSSRRQPRPRLTHLTSLYVPITLPLPLVICARRGHRTKSTPSVCHPRSPYTLPTLYTSLHRMHVPWHVSNIAMALSPPPWSSLITLDEREGV